MPKPSKTGVEYVEMGQRKAQGSLERQFKELVEGMRSERSKKAFETLFKSSSAELGQAAVRGALRDKAEIDAVLSRVLDLLQEWGVKREDQLVLLGCDRGTYDRWANTREFREGSQENSVRLSILGEIGATLDALFLDPAPAAAWLANVNDDPLFENRSPLSFMAERALGGLVIVRLYLDGWMVDRAGSDGG